MQTKKVVLGIAALAALIGGWAAFRPERLFVNQTVNESLATADPVSHDAIAAEIGNAAKPGLLTSGRFHDGAHETSGDASVFRLADGRRVLRLTDFRTSNGPDVQVYLVAADDARDDATVTKSGFVRVAALKGNIGDQNYDLPADVDLTKYRAVTIWCRRFGVNFGTAPLSASVDAANEYKEASESGAMSAGSDAMSAGSDAISAGSAAMSPSGTRELLSGSFHSGAHETSGLASVLELEGGRRVLRLTDFRTSNGPDVQVYLVAASDAKDDATVKTAGFVRIASLKGNIGNQNYDLPADVDLAKYRAVTIWCRRFGVNFGTAPLTSRS